MLHEAKVAKAERKKPKGNQRSGGPRRLMPSEEQSTTPDKEVADYLKRERGVESTTSPTFGDDSQQAIELQRHQIDVAMQRREEAAHRSHVRNARHNMITVSNDDNDGSGPLRESRYDRSASVQSALKRALRSVRSGRRPSVVVRSVKHERESQREVLGTAHL